MRLSLCCACLLLVGALMARQPSSRASIDGFVTSDFVMALPGATIGIDSVTGSFHRQTTTDPSGYYLLDDLQQGAYSLWAEVKGYGCILYPQVAVFRGQHTRQDFHFVRPKRPPEGCRPVEKRTGL